MEKKIYCYKNRKINDLNSHLKYEIENFKKTK